jgi:hypothetical protein
MASKFTIKTAAEKLNLTEFYVRKCIREGKIEAELEQIGATQVERWVITEKALEEFANRPKQAVGKRDDGRNKFTIYLTPEELEALSEWLADNPVPFGRANPPKSEDES